MKHLHWPLLVLLLMEIGCKKDSKAGVAVLTTSDVTSITATSAVTGGTISSNGGSAVTKSGICWATHTNPTVGDSIVSAGGASGSFTTTLAGLNANTTYYVRAFAINNVGTSYGNLDSFLTAQGLPTLTTAAISNVVPLSAQSGATITNDGGAAITARGICWSTSPHPTTANYKTSDSLGIGTFADSLSDLASQATYYVRGYATNSFGTAYGNELNFSAASANTVLDVDGNVYPYIQLGTQFWMATNLRTTHFQNGDPIPNGLTNYNWTVLVTGAFTFSNGDTTTNARYGKLYDDYVVNDSRNACPAGWHIPTDLEWQSLEFYEGMTPADTGTNNMNNRGTIAPKLVVGGSSGLNLTYAGILFPGDGNYYYFGNQAWYQTSTGAYDNTSNFLGNYCRMIDSTNPPPVNRTYIDVAGSVRCIKN